MSDYGLQLAIVLGLVAFATAILVRRLLRAGRGGSSCGTACSDCGAATAHANGATGGAGTLPVVSLSFDIETPRERVAGETKRAGGPEAGTYRSA